MTASNLNSCIDGNVRLENNNLIYGVSDETSILKKGKSPALLEEKHDSIQNIDHIGIEQINSKKRKLPEEVLKEKKETKQKKQKIEIIHPKRKLPAYFSKPKIKSRKILKLDQSASIVHREKKVEFTPEMVKEHAFVRMQIFYVLLLALYGTSVNSKKNEEDLETSVGRARLQGSQGSYGRHAAHAHTAAGLVDNELENLYQRTIEDGLTPTKKPILQALGVTLEELEELATNCDEDLVNAIFKKIVQCNKSRIYSIIGGTTFEQQLNLTDELPRELNLLVDGALEKTIRPKVAELCRSVMLAKIFPETTCKKYHRLIHSHFTNTIFLLRKRIREIRSLSTLIEKASKDKSLMTRIDKLKTSLNKGHLGVPKPKLALTYKYILGLKKGKTAKFKNKTITLKWIKHEQNVQIKKIQRILNYNLWEKAGTQIPDFTLLAGKYNPLTGKREPLTTPERANLSMELIQDPNKPPVLLTPNSLKQRTNVLRESSSVCKRLFDD